MEDLNGAVEDFRKAYTLSAQDRERGVLQKEITRLQKSARIQGGQEAPKLAAKKAKEYVNKKLRVEKNAEKGRHIVAEKSLAADEKVLAQIPPFALELSLIRCHWCCTIIMDSLVPCKSCNFGRYCSADCRDKHAASHSSECGLAFYREAPERVVVAVRTMYRLYQNPATIALLESSASQDGKLTELTMSSTPEEIIVALDRHEEDTPLHTRAEFAWDAVLVHALLSPPWPLRAMYDMLLRVRTNTFAVTKLTHNVIGSRFSDDRVAIAFYALPALLNHSCKPNTKFAYSKDLRLTFVAAKDIKAGEEVTGNYGVNPVRLPLLETRRGVLREKYFFTCNCKVCINQEEEEKMEEGKPKVTEDELSAALAHLEASSAEEFVTLTKKALPAGKHTLYARATLNDRIALALTQEGHIARALLHCQIAVRCLEDAYSENSIELGWEYLKLAELFVSNMKRDEAIATLKKAEAVAKKDITETGEQLRETVRQALTGKKA